MMTLTIRGSVDSAITRTSSLGPLRVADGLTPRWVVLGSAVVLLQRFAVPLGGVPVPLTIVLLIVICISMVAKNIWVVSPARLIAALAFVSAALASVSLAGGGASMFSALTLVIGLWAPGVLLEGGRPHRGFGNVSTSFCTGLTATTAISGLAGAAQSAATTFGAAFFDPISLVPSPFTVDGYQAAQTVEFGGSWFKANGVVFLEPSFLSLTCAIGLLFVAGNVSVGSMRARSWMAVGLVAGLLASGAISGLVVLPFVLASLFRSLRSLWAGVVSGTLLATVALATPLAQSLLERLLFRSGSNDARLVRPYGQILPISLDASPLFGLGPGTSRDLADRLTAGDWQTEVTTPTLVKIIYEYGLVGLALGCIFVILITRGSSVPLMVKAGLLTALIVPTDGLTSHVLVPLFIGTLFSRIPPSHPSGRPRSRLHEIPWLETHERSMSRSNG